ncbi:adhesion G protein-coupled receptor B1-like [Actinia tenebrosa]|uniref:Adhesion G protein-coupled receptor B1-like n=1 Tax=Actinia tenebrosa TaxID=6105 RepID=A0A6P8IHF1_ACTTE|nr:adhesion G protein-coupled receptor B1-like [Actinia tenebrosa]
MADTGVVWRKSLSFLPEISYPNVLEHLKGCGKKNIGEKGYKFFAEAYIHDVHVAKMPGSIHTTKVKAQCYRSQRKTESPHSMELEVGTEDKKTKIIKAKCSCKAGNGGHCNHLFGLLYTLNHWFMLNLNEIPADKTCTTTPTALRTTKSNTTESTQPSISTPVSRKTQPDDAGRITTTKVTTVQIVIKPTSLKTAKIKNSTKLSKSTPLPNKTKLTIKTPRGTTPTNKGKPVKVCSSEEKDGIFWPNTPVRQVAFQPCPRNSTGKASRECWKRKSSGAWGEVNLYGCVSSGYMKIKSEIETCTPVGGNNCSSSDYQKILQDLVNITAQSSQPDPLQGGDLMIAVESLKNIYNHSKIVNVQINKQYVDTASNLMTVNNARTWKQVQQKENKSLALDIVSLLEGVGFRLDDAIEKNMSRKTIFIPSVNIAMRIDVLNSSIKLRERGIQFQFMNTSVSIPGELFLNDVTTKAVTVILPTLSHVLTVGRQPEEKLLTNVTEDQESNRYGTTVVSSTVLPKRKVLKAPIKIQLKNIKFPNSSKVTCVSWSLGSSQRTWSKEGCQLVENESDMEMTTCICNHMTLFAAFMDPYGKDVPDHHSIGLEIISLVGCSISLIAIIATFVVSLFHWQKLKSPRSEILLNICFGIAAVCILVLVEKHARRDKISCILVAILLHYFLLSVFTWMLCEGVLLRMVFFSDITGSGRSKMRHFYCFGWGFPVLIVGISAGATGLDGYGEPNHLCWLSTVGGLSWAFVAPAICVVLVNSIILVSIMKRMFGIQQIKNKRRAQRIVLGVRAMVVILPLLGITWVFGLLAFSSDTIAFKYLFAIFNSLQGVLIFVFHCVLDNKVREAINSSQRRRQSMPMSITRIRPIGKEDKPHERHPSPPAVRLFSLQRAEKDLDSSKNWGDLWAQQDIKHAVEMTNGKDERGKTEENYPRTLRTSSLNFELTNKEIQGQDGNIDHPQVT